MPTQNIPLQWATYIWGADLNYSGYGQGSLRIGIDPSYNKMYRPLLKFAPDAISGQILAATLNFYCDKTGGSNSGFTIHKVNKAAAADATWYYADASSLIWSGLGCSATEEDRTAASLASHQFNSTGWNSISVTNLSLFDTWFASQRTIVLINTETPTNYASIALSPAPYLEVTYFSTLVGGIQII